MTHWDELTVFKAVRSMYDRSAVLARQVASATGVHANRHLDAVAVGVWPSRGLFLHGIEIKVSRSDLKRELSQPEKADEVATYCDRFYIAAPPSICEPAELPETWGLIVAESELVAKVVKHGLPLKPKDVDRPFVAALLRASINAVDESRERRVVSDTRAAIQRENEGLEAIRTALGNPNEIALGRIRRLAELMAKDSIALSRIITSADKMSRAAETLQAAFGGHEI